MRTTAWLLIGLFLVVALGAVWAAELKVEKATGKVSFICPQHKGIKLKTGDKELVLLVFDKCPKKDDLMKQIEDLEVEQEITASYFQCPKTKKLYLTKIEAPEPEA